MNNNNLSFPVLTTSDVEYLRDSHNLVYGTPFNQSSIAYKIILPKGWIAEKDLGQQEQTSGSLVKIGLFAETRPQNPAVVQVFYTSLPFEVGLLDWLEFQSEQTGVRILHSATCELACGRAADVGGVYGDSTNQFIVRSIAHIDNARIFMVSAMVKKERYIECTKEVAIATNFFRLLRPTGGTRFEPLLKIQGKQPNFNVASPASWTARLMPPKLSGKSAVDIFLAKDDNMMAYLRVKATDPSIAGKVSIEEKKQSAIIELLEANVKLQTSWAKDEKILLQNTNEPVEILSASAILGENKVEVRLGLIQRDALDFAVTLISATKQTERILWMRSKRAYEIALDTVCPS